MSKFSKIAAAVAVAPILAFSAPVFADSPGSLSNPANVYAVRNEQHETTSSTSTTAACGETVKYTVLLSNTANGAITNINIKTSLTDGTMTATGSTGTGTTSISGKATVSLPSGASLVYATGSTQVVDYTTHAVISTLADGITTSTGTTVANLAGSTNELVQYEAKVNCPTPTPTPTPTPAPKQLVNTGAGNVIGLFAAVVVASAVAYNVVMRRRSTR